MIILSHVYSVFEIKMKLKLKKMKWVVFLYFNNPLLPSHTRTLIELFHILLAFSHQMSEILLLGYATFS